MDKLQQNDPSDDNAVPLSQPVEAPHRLLLTGKSLRERDRFEVFRENFGRYLYPANVENSSLGTFDGGIELLRAGSVGISRIVAPPSTYTRTRRHTTDADDSLTLFIGLSRGPAIEQADTQHEFRPGNGFLYHGGIPGGCEAAANFDVWGIKVESDRLRSGMIRGRGLKPMGIAAELPAMQLIMHYLNSYSTVANSQDPGIHEAFGTHLADLLLLLVGADRDSLELIKGRGLKAARTEAVLKAIDRDFSFPDLSAEKVGLLLRITPRQVHRLLEETTKTFYEHVLERRLMEAHRLLTDPASAALRVAEIALRAGFVDRSHFHRVFRIRFGDTPTGVREDAAREHAALYL